MPENAVAAIREEHSNSRQFCDGDIYRNLRFHQAQGNLEQEGKWKARLTERKRKTVEQMRRKVGILNRGFDRLLPFIGLWAGLRLGCLNRLLPMRYPEVVIPLLLTKFKCS